MQHHATLEYDAALVSRAVRAYWQKSLGGGVLLAALIAALLFAWRFIEGDRSWVVGLLGAATLLGIVLPALVYAVHYRNSMARLRRMREPLATFSAGDDSFTLDSGAGSSTLPWGRVGEIWAYDDFWLLLFSRAEFATIPLAGVSADMRAFVAERVRANGGRVSGAGFA